MTSKHREDSALVTNDVVCCGCGCLCDDIQRRGDPGGDSQFTNACAKGESYFADEADVDLEMYRVEGQTVSREKAITRAAEILSSANRPLVAGLTRSTVDAQRAAVAIADRTRATIDFLNHSWQSSAVRAVQSVGANTCTLGELKNWADRIIFWRSDPETTHPRLFSQYCCGSLNERAVKRDGRTTLVLDTNKTATADRADQWIPLPPNSDFELFTILRAIVAGDAIDPDRVSTLTGHDLDDWTRFVAQIREAEFTVILFDDLLLQMGTATVQALLQLVRDLNRTNRVACLQLRQDGFGLGAENVLTWTTGYPFAVTFGSGFPEFDPEACCQARMLESGEVDAVLLLGAEPFNTISSSAVKRLESTNLIVLDDRESQAWSMATVTFSVGRFPHGTSGTVFRMDGVPIKVDAQTSSTMIDEAVILNEILEAL